MDTNEKKRGKVETPESGAESPEKGSDPFILEKIYPETALLFASHQVPFAADPNVVVAFDTNALLLPYKISNEDLSALSDVYLKLAKSERILLPARAAREFIKHRDRKLAEMVKNLNDKRSRIYPPDAKLPPLLAGVEGIEEIAPAADELKKVQKKYLAALEKIISTIKGWRGDDPVTKLYKDVFIANRIIEHKASQKEILVEWIVRLQEKIPPGYKDAGKADTGIGDFLIWKSILEIGRIRKMYLIFITGEEKADWFTRTDGFPLYPRPELIDEYRRMSGGKSIRLSTLSELLAEMDAPPTLVEEVRVAEFQANNEVKFANSASDFLVSGSRIKSSKLSFDYSTNNGVVEINDDGRKFTLKFSKVATELFTFTPQETLV